MKESFGDIPSSEGEREITTTTEEDRMYAELEEKKIEII